MGRPAGKPNTQTGQLRDMILTALTNEGGIEYLQGLARHEPKSFAALLGKVLPLQVAGSGDDGEVVIRWER